MRENVFALWAYLRYWLICEDHYSIQGPFLSEIYSGLSDFYDGRKDLDWEIEAWRKQLLQNQGEISVLDLGAGSKKVNSPTRKIQDITRYSTSNRKFCQLYQYFASLTPAKVILELGTCMGVSTRYLAAISQGEVFSFEGSEAIQSLAKTGAEKLPIQFILGDIRQSLPEFLSAEKTVDFALLDANHTYEGTTFSFQCLLPHLSQTSILAIGDIHWSAEMQLAWEEVKSHPSVRVSMDFYEAGILFFDSPLDQPSHLVLST